jgi:DNA-binding transcriptional MerR regulator
MDRVDEPLMSIGAFSRASLLSIAALRKYHEAGILVPAAVDHHSGYRRYQPAQLTDAAILRRLRALDLSLVDVRVILAARDPDVTREVLARHEAVVRERLIETEKVVRALEEDRDSPLLHTPAQVRALPATHTLAIRGNAPEADFPAFFDEAFTALRAAVSTSGAVTTGPPGACFPAEIPDDGPQPIEAFVPVRDPVAPPTGRGRVVVGELPAVHAAVLLHTGPYEGLADAYRTLGAWVARYTTSAAAQVREVYLASYTETSELARFRTEIQWPVLPPGAVEGNTR